MNDEMQEALAEAIREGLQRSFQQDVMPRFERMLSDADSLVRGPTEGVLKLWKRQSEQEARIKALEARLAALEAGIAKEVVHVD